jgi:hypothetical protein
METAANRIEEIYRLVNQWEASETMIVEEPEKVPIVEPTTEPKPEPEVKPATDSSKTEPPANVPDGVPVSGKKRPLRAI